MTEHNRHWLVYGGRAFDIWQPDTGEHFAFADSDYITRHLQTKRLKQRNTSSSAFSELSDRIIQDRATLPCYKPRVAFSQHNQPHQHAHVRGSARAG